MSVVYYKKKDEGIKEHVSLNANASSDDHTLQSALSSKYTVCGVQGLPSLLYWGEPERPHINGLHIMVPFAVYTCLLGDGLVYLHKSI